jgi:hypothetical protein
MSMRVREARLRVEGAGEGRRLSAGGVVCWLVAGALLIVALASTKWLIFMPFGLVMNGVLVLSTCWDGDFALMDRQFDGFSFLKNAVRLPSVSSGEPFVINVETPLSIPIVILLLVGRWLNHRRQARDDARIRAGDAERDLSSTPTAAVEYVRAARPKRLVTRRAFACGVVAGLLLLVAGASMLFRVNAGFLELEYGVLSHGEVFVDESTGVEPTRLPVEYAWRRALERPEWMVDERGLHFRLPLWGPIVLFALLGAACCRWGVLMAGDELEPLGGGDRAAARQRSRDRESERS